MKLKLLFILLLWSVFSCKRLEKKDFLLEIKCENCGSLIEDSLLSLDGIYYVDYQNDEGSLIIKYDKNELDTLLVDDFLIRKGFVFPENDSLYVTIVPDCCME